MATQLKREIECSEEEWQARQDLAACYRIFDHLGWCESIYNHITLRVPGEDSAFLINPYGLLWEEVTASNLVKIDSDGNKLGDNPLSGEQGRFHPASRVPQEPAAGPMPSSTRTRPIRWRSARPKAGCMPTNFYSCFFEGAIGYHDFEGITVRAEEGERLVRNLGNHHDPDAAQPRPGGDGPHASRRCSCCTTCSSAPARCRSRPPAWASRSCVPPGSDRGAPARPRQAADGRLRQAGFRGLEAQDRHHRSAAGATERGRADRTRDDAQ